MADEPLFTGKLEEPYYPTGDEPEETDGIGKLPGLYTFADLMYTPTSSLWQDALGKPVPVVEFKCNRCKRRKIVPAAEAVPPPGKPYPLCGHCLAEGVHSVLVARSYDSGPLEINL